MNIRKLSHTFGGNLAEFLFKVSKESLWFFDKQEKARKLTKRRQAGNQREEVKSNSKRVFVKVNSSRFVRKELSEKTAKRRL